MVKEFPMNLSGFNPFGDLLGLQFTNNKTNTSKCNLKITKNLLNPHGVVHGGVIYSMADTGMGAALYSQLKKNESCSTIEIKIVYLTAVKLGTLTCESIIINKKKRISILESIITLEEHIVAKAIGAFYISKY